MRAVVLSSPGEVEVVDRPDPITSCDLALVRVTSIPICTEFKLFAEGGTAERLGHEAVGEVVETGGGSGIVPGQRVVVQPQYGCGRCSLCEAGEHIHCQQGLSVRELTGNDDGTATYAQFLLKPPWLLSPIPEGVSDEHAGMALCGLGPTFGALQQLGLHEGDTVLISGCGPVGLGGVINARHRRLRVICVEGTPFRAALASSLGADVVLEPGNGALDRILELTSGVGVDAAVDCSGSASAHRLMVDAVRRKGQACFVGEGGEFPLAASRDMIRKGLLLRGVWHYNLHDYPALMCVIESCPDSLDKLITHRFAMSDVHAAWELQATGACGKVLLDPWS